MNYTESLDYLKTTAARGSVLGLDRVKELLRLLGDPQENLNIVHISGTNGKGSFAAMMSSVLRCSGYRTGSFCSPAMTGVTDSYRINGHEITKECFAQLISTIEPYIESMAEKPTEFEVIAAAAYLLFAQEDCDIAVVECGMGGDGDATNLMSAPILSVITNVALDHCGFLGSTIAEIAGHKAGIIKQGCPVYFGGRDSDALAVISKRAEQLGAPLTLFDDSPLSDITYSLDGISFCWNRDNFTVPLCGTYQRDNIVNLMCCVEILRKKGVTIGTENLRRGLAETVWQGRFEVMRRDPYVVFDGAHNPDGIARAAESIGMYFTQKVVLLIGVMADKDYKLYTDMLGRFIEKVFTVTPDNPRALDSAALAKVFTDKGIPAESFEYLPDGVSAAYSYAKEKGLPMMALGSLYMYREFKETMALIPGK
jgi:dihydrofolate synthase/folylpolyglutamate synthase